MAAAGILAVTVLSGAPVIDRGLAAEPASPVEELGVMAMPPNVDYASTLEIMAVDSVARRMYGRYTTREPHKVNGVNLQAVTVNHLAVYDIEPSVPRLIQYARIEGLSDGSPTTPLTTFLEPSRHRIYTIGAGHSTHDGSIVGVDVHDLRAAPLRFVMADKLPGFYPAGITYSAEDDRIYAVGEMALVYEVLQSTGTFSRKATGTVPTVVAFDPDDGTVLWSRAVPQCGQVLYTLGSGSLVVRDTPSPSTPTILFPCSTGGVGLAGGRDTLPGQAGIAELRISPKATHVDAPAFDLHFHAISGTYYDGGKNGIAGYDYGSHRLFMQSISAVTPGAWVFDARAGGWAGSITAKYPTDYYLGVDQGNGHHYMGGGVTSGGNGFLLVADGRATPPQNGILAPQKYTPQGFIATDPPTRRLFVPREGVKGPWVLRDLTPSALPQVRPDYDALTDDVDETPETFVSFTGDSGGFGARITAVGDVAAITGAVPADTTDPTTRGLILARAPGAVVQPAGAAAAAQALGPDTTSDQQFTQGVHADTKTVEDEVRSVLPAGVPSQPPGLLPHQEADVKPPVSPPYPGVTSCLDGGGGVDSEPVDSAGGRSEVRCTLAAYEATATTRQTGSLGAVSVGDTRFETKVRRTAKDGMVTTSTATATGFLVDVPGVGSLRIGSVESKVVTVAHGRSGSASARWTRNIEGVVVKDGGGTELYRTSGCSTSVAHDGRKEVRSGDAGTCDQMADTIRRLLQVRVHLQFPTPTVVATPRGAFSRVGQSEDDAAHQVVANDQGKVFDADTTTRRALPGLQLDVYNDSMERSRYIVQLAAVENSSIYTVNRSGEDAPCDTGGCIPGGFDGPPPYEVDGGSDATATASSDLTAVVADGSAPLGLASTPLRSGRPQSVGDGGLAGLVFSRRSLGDGALMASFLTLVAAAAALVGRRRRLMATLG